MPGDMYSVQISELITVCVCFFVRRNEFMDMLCSYILYFSLLSVYHFNKFILPFVCIWFVFNLWFIFIHSVNVRTSKLLYIFFCGVQWPHYLNVRMEIVSLSIWMVVLIFIFLAHSICFVVSVEVHFLCHGNASAIYCCSIYCICLWSSNFMRHFYTFAFFCDWSFFRPRILFSFRFLSIWK